MGSPYFIARYNSMTNERNKKKTKKNKKRGNLIRIP